MTHNFKTLVPAKVTSEPKEVRRWWIETHESLKNKEFYNRKNIWPQVYNSDVVPNTIEVVEATVYQYAVDQWDYFVEETMKSRTALTKAEREIAKLNGKLELTNITIKALQNNCDIIGLARDESIALAESFKRDCDTLRAQVELAVEALEWIKNMANGVTIPFHANEALLKIKGGPDGKV